MGYVFLIIALVLNAAGNIFLKMASSNIVLTPMGLLTNWSLMLGGSFFVLNLAFYTLALSKINLSVAYPVMTVGGVLIISLNSYFLLHETFSLRQILGIALLLVGIFLVVNK